MPDPTPAGPLAVVAGDGEGFKEVFYRTLQSNASTRRLNKWIFSRRPSIILTTVLFFPSRDAAPLGTPIS
jgi:hypothetical protein